MFGTSSTSGMCKWSPVSSWRRLNNLLNMMPSSKPAERLRHQPPAAAFGGGSVLARFSLETSLLVLREIGLLIPSGCLGYTLDIRSNPGLRGDLVARTRQTG